MFFCQRIFICVVAAVFFIFNGSIVAAPHWTHEEQASWGAIEDSDETEVPHIYPYAECAIGQRQSPIDLADADVIYTNDLNRLIVRYSVDKPVFYNSGHGVQVNTSLNYTGVLEIGRESFPLIQFHFHEPSEHIYRGQQFDAEIHFVHVREDGRIAVMAVLVNEGAEHETLQTILDNTPDAEGERRENTGINVHPASLLPGSVSGSNPDNDRVFEGNRSKPDFVTFAGSLTTPPCSEGVQWIVLVPSITVSAAQLDQLRGLYSDNFRLPQAVNGRSLLTHD